MLTRLPRRLLSKTTQQITPELNPILISNKYTHDPLEIKLTTDLDYCESELDLVNSRILPRFKEKTIMVMEETDYKFKELGFLEKYLIDQEIDGDLDEVVVNVETFSFKEYFKDLYWNGSPEVKKDSFFIYIGRTIRLMLILILFNQLHKIYREKFLEKNEKTMITEKNSFKDLFYKVEYKLHSKFEPIIRDLKYI